MLDLSSVEDPDPFHFGLLNPGNKKSAKIMENSNKNEPKSHEYNILKYISFILLFNA